MSRAELLMPAGDLETFKVACNSGANAIYLGLGNFNARNFAKNFTHEDLIEAIAYAHPLNIKVYVTVNTLVYDEEFEELKKEIDFLYNANVDALIIQDLGILEYISNVYPDFELHASTQMHIHNLAGAKFITQKGISRVVLARETPIEIVKEVIDAGIEVEVFIHGSLCVSYSGQCLMSSFLSDRSANRGKCAQYCRMKYRLLDKNDGSYSDYAYLLSMKDLNTLEYIDELLKIGVTSLKIEGRMKSPSYVGYLARTYRNRIDSYYEGKNEKVDKQTQRNIKVLFNRDFTKGFLNHEDPKDVINSFRPNNIGVEIGRVERVTGSRIDIRLSDTLNQFDGIRIINKKEDTGFIINRMYKNDLLVNSAKANDLITVYQENSVQEKDKVYLTKDNDLEKQILEEAKTMHYKTPIDALLYLDKDNLCLYLSDEEHNVLESVSLDLQLAKNKLDIDRIQKAIDSINDTPFVFNSIDINLDDRYFVPLSFIKQLRRKAIDSLISAKIPLKRQGRLKYDSEGVYVERSDLQIEEIFDIRHSKHQLFINKHEFNIPLNVNPKGQYDVNEDVYFASEIGELSIKTDYLICGSTFNVVNSYALAFLYKCGVDLITLSREMNSEQIDKLLSAFKNCYHENANIVVAKGPVIIMYLKPQLAEDPNRYLLEDYRHNIFPIFKDCNDVTYIFDESNADSDSRGENSYTITLIQ